VAIEVSKVIMGKSITTVSSAIILTAANCTTYNPLSISITGGITNSSGSAIYSNAAELWIINNAGTIASTGVSATYGGIFLKAGGTVTNVAGGLISGVAYMAFTSPARVSASPTLAPSPAPERRASACPSRMAAPRYRSERRLV
jgi:hypothetical protein